MKLRSLLPIIGMIIFIYIILKIGISTLIDGLLLINPIYIVINLILIFIAIIPPIYKWKIILKNQGVDIGIGNLLKIFLISTFYGNITPGKIGTFIRVYYLRDIIKKPLGFCGSSILIDRMLDFLALLLFAMAGILLISSNYMWLFWLLAVGFIISLVSFAFLINQDKNKFILKFIYKYFVPQKFKALAKENYLDFYENIPKIRTLFYPIFLTIISWMLYYSLPYVFIIALGIKINYIYFVFLYALSTLITLIPISIAGLGTREASLIILLGSYGVTASEVVIMSLLSFVLFMVITGVSGWYLSLKWKVEYG